MKESNIQTEFGKRNKHHGIFELKLCKQASLPFSALAEHQEEALLAISSLEGFYYKISDFPMFSENKMRFNRPKPFDSFFLICQPAYVVICFYVPRKKKRLYYIRIQDWIEAREKVGRKSLTEKAAAEYAEIIEDYSEHSPLQADGVFLPPIKIKKPCRINDRA